MPQLRNLLARDLQALLLIQAACPEAAQWPASAWQSFLPDEPVLYDSTSVPRFLAWGAEAHENLLGFIVSSFAADEMEILNLAIAPALRRTGLGSQLLGAAFTEARRVGIARAFLEVRASNTGAIAFYSHHGFSTSLRRPNYYHNPLEDALILSRPLNPNP
jgi:ribosomal-protein-alanine acetyltransferase